MSFPEPAPRAHLEALTGIRGLAAWLVVLYHIRFSLGTLLPGQAIAALGKGYLAVDLFFVLSGFVLWYNYGDRLRAGGWGETLAFLWRRLARIWPLHLFILAGFVALALLFALTGRDASDYPFAELPLHALLMQNWGFTRELAWNHPAWSISTELAAYLLFPLAVRLFRRDRLPVPALIGAALLLLAAIHVLFALNGETGLGAEISRLGLWRCLMEFTLGTIACRLWTAWRDRRYAAVPTGLACAGILCAGVAFSLPETAFVPAAFVTGILALALDRGVVARALGGKAIRYLGEISYSTYLAHYFLFILFKLAFVDRSLQLGWIGFGGFLAMVLAASIALYHGVEKPAQAWLNRHRPHRLAARSIVPAQ